MSGHFATLLAGTVRTMLLDHVVDFLQAMGPRSHVFAVCQPCVPVLAAVALLAEDRNLAQPASMTLVAGPVDVEVSPTQVNALARAVPPGWFRDTVVTPVPPPYTGAR